MYAINDYVIAKESKKEAVTSSGIHLTTKQADKYLVVDTTELTKDLQDRTVVPMKAEKLEEGYYAINYKDIIAVLDK